MNSTTPQYELRQVSVSASVAWRSHILVTGKWNSTSSSGAAGVAAALRLRERPWPPRQHRRRASDVTDGTPKLYAYVHKEVPSTAARLDQILSRNGVASDERVSVISDDVGEFENAVQDSQLARGRILNWFHIAMKFKAAQRSVFGSKMIASLERESVETEITLAKWLVWHGKGSQGGGAEGTGRSASQGPADQQQHRRVRGEPGRQPSHGQEGTDALD
jgi:hypothetical protein